MTVASWGYPAPTPEPVDITQFLAATDEAPGVLFAKIGPHLIDLRRVIAVTSEAEGFSAVHLEHGIVIDLDMSVDEVLERVTEVAKLVVPDL